jgi:hypothetical protein
MMILPRSLFAVALVLGGSAAARAADRPAWASAPIQSLETCPGAGIAIPGSSTCVHFSGSLRAETTVRVKGGGISRTATGRSFRNDLTHSRAVGYVNIDARTPTALGDVRTYASVRVQSPPPDLVRR